MCENPVPNVEVDERVQIGLSLAAVVAGGVAAYYMGQTGEPHPLLWVCTGITLFVLFFASDE